MIPLVDISKNQKDLATPHFQHVLSQMRSKVVLDLYELLHQAEVGGRSPEALRDLFGSDNNLQKSNERQVDRIRKRCADLGLGVAWDDDQQRYIIPSSSSRNLGAALSKIQEAPFTLFSRFSYRRGELQAPTSGGISWGYQIPNWSQPLPRSNST